MKWEPFFIKEKDKYWDQKMTLPSSRVDNPGSNFLFPRCATNSSRSCQVCIPRPEEKIVALDRAIDDRGDARKLHTTNTLRILPSRHHDRAFSQGKSEVRKITLASQAFLAYSFVATPILHLSEVSSER